MMFYESTEACTVFASDRKSARIGVQRKGLGRSSVRRSGHAHGLDHALALREKHGVVALAESAQALDRKFRVDCKTGPDRCAGFVKPAQMGEAGGEIKVGPGIVGIGVD